ncbi:MAG: pantoate--beta-alanine ligase [Candidatus Omnitrophica bacterium]|nr:pantoate--beta-alanine ligase [Candidatus Omnitrophota bacterium]
MKIYRKTRDVSAFVKSVKAKGKRIGFIPTMGYLHEGHLSLMRRARQETDVVVISIFVNPKQFGPKEDYRRYPRNIKKDERLARLSGVDLIFYPSVSQVYPKGYLTHIDVEGVTEGLCGVFRPGHFRGVATVCCKLFNIVRPEIAYFGWKDAQQAIMIKRMVKDLNMDLAIKALPIVREADGLAMSSRNKRLSSRQRKDAAVLYKALSIARRLIREGQKSPVAITSKMGRMIKAKKGTRIDYISIVDEGLAGVKRVKKGNMIALAVWFGKTRLIDNVIV